MSDFGTHYKMTIIRAIDAIEYHLHLDIKQYVRTEATRWNFEQDILIKAEAMRRPGFVEYRGYKMDPYSDDPAVNKVFVLDVLAEEVFDAIQSPKLIELWRLQTGVGPNYYSLKGTKL